MGGAPMHMDTSFGRPHDPVMDQAPSACFSRREWISKCLSTPQEPYAGRTHNSPRIAALAGQTGINRNQPGISRNQPGISRSRGGGKTMATAVVEADQPTRTRWKQMPPQARTRWDQLPQWQIKLRLSGRIVIRRDATSTCSAVSDVAGTN